MGLFPHHVRVARECCPSVYLECLQRSKLIHCRLFFQVRVSHVRGGVQEESGHDLDHEAGGPSPRQRHISIHRAERHNRLEKSITLVTHKAS